MGPKNQKHKAVSSGSKSSSAAVLNDPNKKNKRDNHNKQTTDKKMDKRTDKKTEKAEKREMEARRIRERDAMMDISDDTAEEEEHDSIVGSHMTHKFTVDKFGNTVSKAKAKEEERIEAMRAAARARRAAKEAAGELGASADVTSKQRAKADVDSGISASLSSSLKLSHKEKKAIKAAQRSEAENSSRLAEEADGLGSFSLSVQRQHAFSTEGDGEDGILSATDIIIPSFTLTAPGRVLLQDATLRIVSGRRYGLLGPNGRGKTTLLKFLAARRLPVPPGVDVLLVQQEVLASTDPVVEQVLSANARRSSLLEEEAQLLAEFKAQDDMSSAPETEGSSSVTSPPPPPSEGQWTEDIWNLKLDRFAAIGEELEAIGADACEAKVRRILTGLGFSEEMQDGPSTVLSGGWRMRVSLAQALFMEPKLLLLDEPTNHLDLNAVLWLDDYLSNYWTGSLLVVSHDADFLDSICTDIIHLDSNQLHYYSGSYSNFEGMRGQIESKKERDYKHQQKTLKEFKAQGLKTDKAERKAMQKLGVLSLLEPPKEYRVNFKFKANETDAGAAVDVLDGSFSYGDRELFCQLRFRVDTYSRIAIVGPNGAGKSTLLKLITGGLQVTSGEVLRHSRLRIGRYDQHFEELLPFDITPVDFLTSSYSVDVSEARKYLGMFGLDGTRHLIRIRQLSGGQKARVVLASLSLQKPHILVLDEPTNHLDMESVEALISGIRDFPGGVVLVSHDARLISATECELWVCGDRSTGTGVRVENRGFERYRLDVITEVHKQQERAEMKAKERARVKKNERAGRLSRRRTA